MPVRQAARAASESGAAILWAASLLALSLATRARAGVTPQIERAVRAATFELVLEKPIQDPLSYEKPLPLDLIPYQQRTDKYQPVGTAFALRPDTYVTAAHVLEAAVDSQYGKPALRAEDGKVYPIASITAFSADEDYAVFTLVNAPNPTPLKVNAAPELDEPVFAVGTALGEGIVIRDGLYTSDTPEDQDGRWKWIRFSAAASPGNSGGPLLDTHGNVIGIVIAKSPNENLNYALPIGLVLNAPRKALFDRRFLTKLPFIQGSRVYTLKDGFTLPLSWTAFEHDYQQVIERHNDDARAQLLAADAASMFPRGSGSDAILYSTVDPTPDLGLIVQQESGEWTLDRPSFDSSDLPGNGRVSVAYDAGATLLRLVRANDASDGAFYGNSREFMDVALKGFVIRRVVGSDTVRVTSLGPAMSDTVWTDDYGRKWQQRVWALPYLDSYLVAFLLPTPDGYAGLLRYSQSSTLSETKADLALLTNQVDLVYRGTLEQWTAFLSRRTLLPAALSQVSLAAAPTWTLRSPRFEMSVPPGLVRLGAQSRLCLAMTYDARTAKPAWDIAGAWWYQDSEEKDYVALWRQPRPPATARLALQDAYSDMQNRASPFDGQPLRVSAGAITIATVMQAEGTRPGTAAADVLYARAIGAASGTSIVNLSEKERLAGTSIHILEHGTGADVAMVAPTPDVRSQLESHIEQYGNLMASYDNIYGPDIRGRKVSQDVSDYIIAPYRKAALTSDTPTAGAARPADEGGSFTKVVADLTPRLHALQDYWRVVSSLMHNRDLWASFLAQNGMSADTPHDPSVLGAESALRQELAGGDPNPKWSELARALRDAYVAERKQLVSTRSVPANLALQPRSTKCPPAAAMTSGRPMPVLNPLTKPLADFYPDTMRHSGVEGAVLLRIRIDASGCVAARAVVGSSGSEDLDQAALRWIETASYLPAVRGGHAVAVVATQAVNFSLSN